jgi:hypothetical protein
VGKLSKFTTPERIEESVTDKPADAAAVDIVVPAVCEFE